MTLSDQIITLLFFSISWGLMLSMIAIGFTLVFGLMGVVNFAHGEFFAVGAYTGALALAVTGNFFIAIVSAIIVGGVVGAVVEITLIRPLYDRELIYQIPVTFGAAFIILGVREVLVGADVQAVPFPSYLSGQMDILGLSFGVYRVFLILISLFFMGVLGLFLQKTRYGLVIRSAMSHKTMVKSLGYDLSKIYTLMFVIGSCYAALAGILVSPILTISTDMGTVLLIDAVIVVIIGGMGSYNGTIIGGLLVGFVDIFGRFFLPISSIYLPFILLIIFLFWRPEGMYGEKGVFD